MMPNYLFGCILRLIMFGFMAWYFKLSDLSIMVYMDFPHEY
jgi:hypothetical protein